MAKYHGDALPGKSTIESRMGRLIAPRLDPFLAFAVRNPSDGFFFAVKPFNKIDSAVRAICNNLPCTARNMSYSE